MNDDQIKKQLGEMYQGGTPEAVAVLSRAIELGASSNLIRYTLFEMDYQESEFQLAFLENQLAWQVFSLNDLIQVFKRLAEKHPIPVLRLIRRVEDKVGHEAAYSIICEVASNLTSIQSDDELKLVEGLPRDLKERVAREVRLDWRTIPFVVRTLKARANNWSWCDRHRYQRPLFRKEWPLSVPVGLRWAMLGGEVRHFPGDKLPPIEDDFVGLPGHPEVLTWWQQLRRSAEDAGWRFVKLREHVVRGEKVLLAEVDSLIKGVTKVVYVHDNNGPRGDHLSAGDEVMVLANPITTKIPVGHLHDLRTLIHERRGTEIWVKEHELHPVRPPTPAMLKNPKSSFHGEDIPLTPKK